MQITKTVKQASWLSLLCTLWLQYHNEDVYAARATAPSFDMPTSFESGKRFNTARKGTGAWDRNKPGPATYKYKVNKDGSGSWRRAGRTLDNQETIPVAYVMDAERWEWGWVFDHWMDGGLDRSIKAMMKTLPKDNRESIKKEMSK